MFVCCRSKYFQITRYNPYLSTQNFQLTKIMNLIPQGLRKKFKAPRRLGTVPSTTTTKKQIIKKTIYKPYKPVPTAVSLKENTKNKAAVGLKLSSTTTTQPGILRRKFKPPSTATTTSTTSSKSGLLRRKFKPPTTTGTGGSNRVFKKPKKTNYGVSSSSSSSSSSTTGERSYYLCTYSKRSNKKRKDYIDGVVVLESGQRCILQTLQGKQVARVKTKFTKFENDYEFDIGYNEVTISNKVANDDYESGRVFLNAEATSSTSIGLLKMNVPLVSFKRPGGANFKKVEKKLSKPRHDPNAPGAVVLARGVPGRTVPVVLDPFFLREGRSLRPHQIEGVKFLYDSVTGVASNGQHCGCILADEMGLGKTLQSIALVWTLLKQGPTGKPTARQAVIVTPSSLVMNWAAEFRKWLGNERCRPIAVNKSGKAAKEQVMNFVTGQGNVAPVLIISYEMCSKYAKEINQSRAVGLMICDEGHRLKNSKGNKTIRALKSFRTNRIVLLTGTPVQNRLEEFYAMADFCNPMILGDLKTFKSVFQVPIDSGRDKNAKTTTKELGEKRSAELSKVTSGFVLRRTAEINQKYLPPRHEIVIFCRLTTIQLQMYRAIVTGPDVSRFRLGQKMRPGSDAMALPVISSLKELCNHPELIRNTTKDYLENARVLLERTSPSLENKNGDDNNGDVSSNSSNSSSSGGGGSSSNTGKYDTIIKVPAVFDPTLSSKMTILIAMLERTASLCDDRFVLVSNYTKTLDLMQAVCDDRGWNAVRLDGSTKNSDRQNIVDQFNSSHSNSFIFLLSSKAGGCGLNLIGANRLVLFDPAWNPATDRQAMARVWRDGQTKSVFIYRMLSTASLEEKIYQRQILKEEVAAAVGTFKIEK